MNASSPSFPGGSANEETTAELPVLDVAAYEARQGQDPMSSTDTWASPTLNTAILPQLPTLAPDPAPAPVQQANLSAKLETELRSLASNLAELESRLAAKGERLAAIEAELAQSRIAGQAAATRAATLSEELAASRAAVAAATAEIEGLHATLQEREDSVRVAGERESELRMALERREAELARTVAAEAAKHAALAEGHENALNVARQQVAQLQAQSAAQAEALQSLEGRRGIFDSMLRTLDMQIVDRDREYTRLAEDLARNTTHSLTLTRELESRAERVTQLEAEVAALNSRLGARMEEAGTIARTNDELHRSLEALRQESTARAARVAQLEAQLLDGNQAHAEALSAARAAHSDLAAAHTALTARNAALDVELAALREQSAEHVAAVQQVTAEHANRLVQIEARDARIAALTEQAATQARTIHAEAERLRVTEERIAIAENDLRVSEEAIHRLESEVRSRSMQVEELTHINSRMQAEVADAKRWLDERDSLMQRLETETAHSAALVDNIQRSIRSLAPGATGPHELIRESGARLLVRSQDGHEVVHVLGRKTTIGRTPDNDLQIDASFISRHHAVVLISGPQTIIEDLNSTNGIHVNGRRIGRETLKDGDLVMIGKAKFRFAVRAAVARGGSETPG